MAVSEKARDAAAPETAASCASYCEQCGGGKLILVAEVPDSNFGALGVTWQIFQCTNPFCRAQHRV